MPFWTQALLSTPLPSHVSPTHIRPVRVWGNLILVSTNFGALLPVFAWDREEVSSNNWGWCQSQSHRRLLMRGRKSLTWSHGRAWLISYSIFIFTLFIKNQNIFYLKNQRQEVSTERRASAFTASVAVTFAAAALCGAWHLTVALGAVTALTWLLEESLREIPTNGRSKNLQKRFFGCFYMF